MAAWVKFRGLIKIRGVNPYVDVSLKRAQLLKKNWRRPIPVLVRINGLPKSAWRINMMPTGDGNFYLYLHQKVRDASRTVVGDRVNIELSFDLAYRNGPLHPMPIDFKKALSGNSKAKLSWLALSPSRQKEILRYLASLKSLEAKARNLKKAMVALSGVTIQFMGREWRKGK